MKNNITAIITARMGSSRFPGKTLSDLLGKPMLARLVERLHYSKYIQKIVVATTELPQDNEIESWCESHNILCFRGSSEDVLGRINAAAKYFRCSTIVEILGDNPLVHNSMLDAAVNLFLINDLDYAATLTNEYPKVNPALNSFPIGIRVVVYSLNTLRKCNKFAKTDYYREHSTMYVAHNPENFELDFVTATGIFSNCNRPDLTLAVNHKKNLELIRNIYRSCFERNPNFGIEASIQALNENPQWHNLMGD